MTPSLTKMQPVSFSTVKHYPLSGWEEPAGKLGVNRRILAEIQKHLESIIVKVSVKAAEMLLIGSSDHDSFQIDPMKLSTHYEVEYKKNIAQNLQQLHSEGYSTIEASTIIRSVMELSRKFLTENKALFFFSFKDKLGSIVSWSRQATLEEYLFCSQKLGELKHSRSLTYTPEDLVFLAATPKDACPKLSCYLFALLLAREEKAKEWITENKEIDPQILELLVEWGYLSTPQPQPGDLVLYFKDNSPTHMGRVVENGDVESKIGYACPFSCIHGLWGVPKDYGNRLVFMRK